MEDIYSIFNAHFFIRTSMQQQEESALNGPDSHLTCQVELPPRFPGPTLVPEH
jgi:hypothetical protein